MILRSAQLLVLLLIGLAAPSARAEQSVVLVTSEQCSLTKMSMIDVRKAYLGIAVSHDHHTVRAFRLNNDAMLNQIFFQSVVAMSERTYERRLVSMALKFGTPRPREHDSVEGLLEALSRSDCAIGYMWRDDADAAAGIRVVRVLWQGE